MTILKIMSESTTSPKKELFKYFAGVAKALAQANRLEILETIAQGERNVETISKACGLSFANTSHHLQILRDSGLVKSRRDGLQIIYRLSDDEIPNLISSLQKVGEKHLAEIDKIVRDNFLIKDNLEPVSRTDLLKMIQDGEVVVVDVRPEDEFASGHISGARNIPLSTLPDQLKSLPGDVEIVAYCRGAYCMLAFDAVEMLRKAGYNVRRLEDGYPEWKASHMPVETKLEP